MKGLKCQTKEFLFDTTVNRETLEFPKILTWLDVCFITKDYGSYVKDGLDWGKT